MKISAYNYSYANAIGSTLKIPLFTLVKNVSIASSRKPWETQAIVIGRVAIHAFIALLLIVPSGIMWFLGKAITSFSSTIIDEEGLSLAPPKMEAPELKEEDANIDFHILAERYASLNCDGPKVPGKTSKAELFKRLCTWISTENENIFPDDPNVRKHFCEQMKIYLKVITKYIESGTLSKDKIRDILMELAEVSTRCYPTWLEVSAKIYGELSGQAETPEVQLLRYIQDYKELLILEFCQNDMEAQWHGLNFARNVAGLDLGLNVILNKFDPYAGHDDLVFSKAIVKWLFLQRYTNTNRMIAAVLTMINAKPYQQGYFNLLQQIVQAQGIPNSKEYIEENFYTESYKLNERGLNLMLRTLGILR